MDFNTALHVLTQQVRNSKCRSLAMIEIARCLNYCRDFKANIRCNDMKYACLELSKMCFEHKIKQSEIVLMVLKSAIESDTNSENGAFNFILNISLKSQDSRISENRMISIQHGERLLTLNVVGYYLHFANQNRFLQNTKRFTDLSEHLNPSRLERLLTCRPNSVLTLFQYGARFFGEEKSLYPTEELFMPSTSRQRYIYIYVRRYARLILEGRVDDKNPHIKDMVDIMKIIMRVIPNPQEITYEVVRQVGISRYIQLHEFLFPGLNFGMNQPASLKHLCRYYIRLRMNENWQLPYGIDALEIPRTLKCYLNLLDD